LEFLDISGTRITGAGVARLATMRSLKTLFVSAEQAEQDEVAALNRNDSGPAIIRRR